MTWKILGLLVNPFTADDMYSLLNRGNLLPDFKCNYVRIEKYFPDFFWHFGNDDSILTTFNKKMTLIADAFFKLRNPKNVLR